MRLTAITIVLICATALGGCAYSRPPANHAFLDMYDRPTPKKKRKASPTTVVSQPNPAPSTTPSTTVGARPGRAEYSPEWWAAEHERERREDERLKRAMNICRC